MNEDKEFKDLNKKITHRPLRKASIKQNLFYEKVSRGGGGNLFSYLYFFPKSGKIAVKRTVQ